MTGREPKSQKRLQQYRNVLESSPAYAAAIASAQAKNRSPDTSLYLYAIVPTLTEFVSWTLDRASGSHKERLYFLSRDGYQMYLIAQKLTELRRLPIECRYLNVSRYSMRLPRYHLDLKKSIDSICTGGIDVTPEQILRRAAFSPEEISEILRDIGWQDRQKDILNYRQIQKLKQILRGSTKILQYVEKHSGREYENALGYLEQEGLLSDISYAVVDSGWVGTLQETIQALVQSKKPEIRVEGYYFGMYELPRGADARSYHAWYFSHSKGLKRKAGFSNSLFETVCSADEGMTMYYRKKDGSFLPVKDSSGNPNSLMLKRNLAALQDFLAALEETFSGEPGGGIRLAEKLFILFMSRPTETEVLAYGDSLFSDDVLEGNRKKAAAELTEKEIRNQRLLSRLLIAAGIRKTTIRESAWIEGSIVRCGRHVRVNLAHVRLYKYFVFAKKQWRTNSPHGKKGMFEKNGGQGYRKNGKN